MKTFLNVVKKIGYDIRVVFIRTIKFNLGINGTIEDEDSHWDDLPDGGESAMLGNVFSGLVIGRIIFSGHSHQWEMALSVAAIGVVWTLFMGEVFMLVRRWLGFKFPLGDHFCAPTEVLGEKYKRN